MQLTLTLATLWMGLAGGPHCVAMCGVACANFRQTQATNTGVWKFHLGRLIGYASIGALVASSVHGLVWVSKQTLALHILWTLFHVLVLAWGLILLLYARQPIWANNVGRKIWKNVRSLSNLKGGLFITGALWALMPCGLLYSALIVASLSASPIQGAVSMSAFAIGTSISLMLAPWFWRKLKQGNKWLNENTSMRLAGLLLISAAGWAIWMNLVHETKAWCY